MQTIRRLAGAFLILASLSGFSIEANAQQLCLLRDTAIEKLQKNFEEQIVGRGLTQEGKAMFELFTSETGTWTLIVTDTEGNSCIIANGEGWFELPIIKGDPA